jgi:hypothetical protein
MNCFLGLGSSSGRGFSLCNGGFERRKGFDRRGGFIHRRFVVGRSSF